MTQVEEKLQLIIENKKLIDKLDSKFVLDEDDMGCESISVRNICGIPLNGRIYTDEHWDRVKILIDGEEFELFKGNREIATLLKKVLTKQIEDCIIKPPSNNPQQKALEEFLFNHPLNQNSLY